MAVHSRAITNTVDANEYIANEIPNGLIDSSNNIFTLAQIPIPSSLTIYLNGLEQKQGSGEDYIVSGSTIIFSKPPRNNSEISATYIFNS